MDHLINSILQYLDGNTYEILGSLVNICGVDAYHSIKLLAGMDIVKVKSFFVIVTR